MEPAPHPVPARGTAIETSSPATPHHQAWSRITPAIALETLPERLPAAPGWRSLMILFSPNWWRALPGRPGTRHGPQTAAESFARLCRRMRRCRRQGSDLIGAFFFWGGPPPKLFLTAEHTSRFPPFLRAIAVAPHLPAPLKANRWI